MKDIFKRLIIFLFFLTTYTINLCVFASDGDFDKVQNLINTSDTTLKVLSSNQDLKHFSNYLSKSKGVLIFPETFEGGFIFGAKGGNGLLLIRTEKGWSGPFFFTVGGLSVGLQLGLKSGRVVMTIMSLRGLKSILGERVKLGVDIDAAVATKGIGYSAESTLRLADIFSFSDNKGLFLGGSIEGSYLQPRNDLNFALYKKKLNKKEILNFKELHPSANKLSNTLKKIDKKIK